MHEERIKEALRMVQAFESVGIARWDWTVSDIDRRRIQYRAARNSGAMRLLIPEWIPRAWASRYNLIVRPHGPAYGTLAQLDDLDAARVATLQSRAFLVVETSPGNYQAWFAIRGATRELARRLARAAGADECASLACRLAGAPNVKAKYSPDFPTVRLARINCERIAATDHFTDLVPPPPPPPPVQTARASKSAGYSPGPRGWPDYERCLCGAPAAASGEPDRSRADFLWCRWALERGNSIAATESKLLEVSEKAREENKRANRRYVERTVERAAATVGMFTEFPATKE